MKSTFQRREKIILISVLLLSTLTWATLDFYRDYRDRKEVAARHAAAMAFQPSNCQRLLYFLDVATTKWATNTHQFTTNYPTAENLQAYLEPAAIDLAIALPIRNFPSCPDGGNYTYGTLALATICSKHGHAILPHAGPFKGPPYSIIDRICDKLGLRRHRQYDCYSNLRIMDGAAQQWGLENKKIDSDLVSPVDAAQYMRAGQFGLCPQGGKYIYTTLYNAPCCTITGHTLP
ncbi:MAG TPA: hypothetical protein VGH19_16430 [Verrucomicrobiae bacterium]